MAGGIRTERLTDRAIQAFLAGAQPGRKLADGSRLYLSPSGGATWRIEYRIGGVEKTCSVVRAGDGAVPTSIGRRRQCDWHVGRALPPSHGSVDAEWAEFDLDTLRVRHARNTLPVPARAGPRQTRPPENRSNSDLRPYSFSNP